MSDKRILTPDQIVFGGIVALLLFAGFQAWHYQKNKAEFFQQIHERSAYRQGCMEDALKTTEKQARPDWTALDRMKIALVSDGYERCIKAEPQRPALDHYL